MLRLVLVMRTTGGVPDTLPRRAAALQPLLLLMCHHPQRGIGRGGTCTHEQPQV